MIDEKRLIEIEARHTLYREWGANHPPAANLLDYDVPALVAEVRRLRAENIQLKAAFSETLEGVEKKIRSVRESVFGADWRSVEKGRANRVLHNQ